MDKFTVFLKAATAWNVRDATWWMVIAGIDADSNRAEALKRWIRTYCKPFTRTTCANGDSFRGRGRSLVSVVGLLESSQVFWAVRLSHSMQSRRTAEWLAAKFHFQHGACPKGR